MIGKIKFDSSYEPISTKLPFHGRLKCCYTTNSDGSTICKSNRFLNARFKHHFLSFRSADERSSCSMSHNDIRHQLIVSTSSSMTSPSASRGTNTSDFGTIGTASPTTMSTVYQSQINPYLTAISRESTSSVRYDASLMSSYECSLPSVSRHRIHMLQSICIPIRCHH